MDLDEELCLCFHVTQRKVIRYLQVERPRRASQLSECQGAGTGCGWCRPYLSRLFNAWQAEQRAKQDEAQGTAGTGDRDAGQDAAASTMPTAEQYARQRADYIRRGGGTPPPGATPPDS